MPVFLLYFDRKPTPNLSHNKIRVVYGNKGCFKDQDRVWNSAVLNFRVWVMLRIYKY